MILKKIHIPNFVEIFKQHPDCLLKFLNDTAASLINDINNLDPKQDPNIRYTKLHETVQHYKEMHMPIKLVQYNKYKHKTIIFDYIWTYTLNTF